MKFFETSNILLLSIKLHLNGQTPKDLMSYNRQTVQIFHSINIQNHLDKNLKTNSTKTGKEKPDLITQHRLTKLACLMDLQVMHNECRKT